MKTRASYSGGDIRHLILQLRGVDDEFDQLVITSHAEQERSIVNSKVVAEVGEAIAAHEEASSPIIIFGDYDADGVCATSIAKRYIKSARFFIPERRDGYGLTRGAIEKLHARDGMVITVDCGIKDTEQIASLRSAGNFVVVTDHHEPNMGSLPSCPIVHPMVSGVEFTGYSGSGVIYKLMREIYGDDDGASQLAAIGTVCDVMPMLDENRLIVRNGLASINKSPIPGVAALIKAMGRESGSITESDIGFYLGPAINACGRKGNAQLAAELLMADEYSLASEVAERVKLLNDERKEETKKYGDIAIGSIVYDGKVVVVVSEENLAGMLGLVANEISNRYSRPAVVFCDAGDHYVGSCRGPDKFNCNEMIRTLGNLVISGGGHKGAAGMSVSKEKIRLVVEEIVRYSDLLPPITVSDYMADIEMDCSYIPLVESEVNKLSPFGHKFEAPVFASTIYVDAINWIGKTQKHIRVTSSDIDFLFFNASGDIMSVEQGDTIRVAYELSRSRSKFAKRPSVITRVMEKLS